LRAIEQGRVNFAPRAFNKQLSLLKKSGQRQELVLRRDALWRSVEQALIGFGILHDRFCLSIDGKNQRFLRFLEMLHELPRIAAKRRHRLNVFFDVKHNDLAVQ
jgi:hypothetical protein